MAKAVKVSTSQRRLAELMTTLNINQADLCKRTGIKKASMSNYVNGNREPNQTALFQLSEPFGINPAWLMGYDVPMYLSDKIKDIEKRIDALDATVITANEKAMVIAYRNADADTQKMIKRLLAYSEKYGEPK